jgi:hypothetical protein
MTCRRAVRHAATHPRDRPPDAAVRPIRPMQPRPPAMPSRRRAWRDGAEFALCQAGWWLCVLGAARHAPAAGIAFAVGLVAGHLVSRDQPARATALVVAVTLVGWLWDSLLARTGLLVYVDSPLPATAAPAWMAALWAMFAIQLDGPLRALHDHRWLAVAVGALAGPLSFRAGAALGAVQLVDPTTALIAIGLGWACLLPACLALARRCRCAPAS